MARRKRIYVPGMTYHVMNRGLNRAAIFEDDIDHEWFLLLVERAAGRYDSAVHAFVLMDNHYHLMVTPGNDKALAQTMKAIGRDYVRYYNRKRDRIGTMWNGRYTAIPILDPTYWLTCLRYIEQNPVRARMVTDPADYRWSTYRIHALGQRAGWIDLHEAYLALGPDNARRQLAYREMCGVSVSAGERVRL